MEQTYINTLEQLENTNKLIKQFYAKKMEVDKIKQKENLEIMYVLNTQPKKKLGYNTPEEVFFITLKLKTVDLHLLVKSSI